MLLLFYFLPTIILHYGQLNLPGYMISSSQYTAPQSRRIPVHFFVSSNVARYSDLRSAMLLGKTLLWRFKRL